MANVDIGPFHVGEEEMFRVRPRETVLLRAFVLKGWQAHAMRQHMSSAREGWVMVEIRPDNFAVMDPQAFAQMYEKIEMNLNGGPG